jgi:hypothetical protein
MLLNISSSALTELPGNTHADETSATAGLSGTIGE